MRLLVGIDDSAQAREAAPLLDRARAAPAGVEVETRVCGGGSPAATVTSLCESEAPDGLVLGFGTPESKVALQRARDLVDPDGEIKLMTVVDPAVPLSFAGPNVTVPTDPEAVIAEGLPLLPRRMAIEARRLEGTAAPGLEQACAQGIDLLVP